MLKAILPLALAALGYLPAAHGELLGYEPFDYTTVNQQFFGRLTGRNGGVGFSGPWQGDGTGNAFVYDKQGNPTELYDGLWGEGRRAWDGVVDNLPTLGGYVRHPPLLARAHRFPRQRRQPLERQRRILLPHRRADGQRFGGNAA